MSDDFIPFNQSTPKPGKWQRNNQNQRRFQNSGFGFQNGNRSYDNRRGNNYHNRWGNNSQRNSSYGSDSNSSVNKSGRNDIDAYLHPSMLQDPWQHLRKSSQNSQ